MECRAEHQAALLCRGQLAHEEAAEHTEGVVPLPLTVV